MAKNLILALIFIFSLSGICLGLDLPGLNDSFYAGLADIIEANLDSPEQCLSEVDSYYASNQDLIAQIRQASQEAVSEAAPMIQKTLDEYSSMSEEELAARERKGQAQEPALSAVLARYRQVLQDFTTRYPQEGAKIGLKAMQLITEPQPAPQESLQQAPEETQPEDYQDYQHYPEYPEESFEEPLPEYEEDYPAENPDEYPSEETDYREDL